MLEGGITGLLQQVPMLAGLDPTLLYLLAAFVGMNIVMLGIVTPYSLFVIWAERKVAAHTQDRIGPMIPGGWHGWATTICDGIKLLLKEDLIPRKGDKLLFTLAPMLVFAGAFAIYAVIPWGPGMVPAELDIGAFFVIAISSISTVGIIMAGWASNNKFSLIGAMRSAAQAVSFEIPLVLSFVPVLMHAGTLNLVTITEAQSGGILDWNLLAYPPLLIIAFVSFYISGLAEVNRTPFDMPEAEQEIVGGFHVEFSGIRFGMFFLGEYAAMLAISLFASVLFLGGHYGMVPVLSPLPTAGLAVAILLIWIGGNAVWEWLNPRHKESMPMLYFNVVMTFVTFLLPVLVGTGPVTLFVKAFGLVFLMLWLRWTLPRTRPDQLMYTCWKVLIPVALAVILAVGVLKLWV